MNVSVPKGGVIFQQDVKPDAFYLIYAGSVTVVRKVERKESTSCDPREI